MKPAVRVLVTGAAGQIAYSLIHSICKGDVFGKGQPIILHLLDIPQMMGVLEGVVMEINDCAFDTVQEVVATCTEVDAFKGIDAAFLVGAMPRREGMERKDLLSANVKIFKSQGKALDTYANKDCKILVVGNPANTNALICSHYAPSIPKENFSAMTRLDHNRALAQLADKLKVNATDIHDVVIWGNHSLTQFPDASNARFFREGTQLQVTNELPPEYLLDEFVTVVQKRGGAVISARKLSSAMSAAKAAVDHMHDWWHGTGDRLVSMAVYSDNSPYPNVPGGLFFSFPVNIDGNRKWHIKDGLTWNDTAEKKIAVSITELQEEKQEAMVVCSD